MPDGSLEHAIAVDTSSAEPMPNVPPREHPARPSTAAGAQPLPGTSAQSQRKHREPAASRFGTGEFKVYYLVYLTMVPYMAYTMWQASSPARAAYAEYSHELSPGWLLGRKIDLSDGQWSTFREHLPAFALAMFAFVALNRVAQACMRPGLAGQRGALRQLWFTGAYALAFVVVLSGASVVFVAGFAWGNYALARACAGRRWAPAAFWAYGLAMLFANEHYHGYRFGDMSASLEWLDAWRGLLPRWDVTFNLTMLRMLSFSMDLHWRRQQERAAGADRVDALAAGGADPERQRVERAAFAGNYCFGNYWAYVAYPPLYLTGPVITFNDFVAQKRQPARVGGRAVAAYGARLAAAMLLMELVLHSVYSVAICKWAQWDAFSVFEISLLGYMRLTFIWLKLLIIWRFARFWALADGLATTENMRRCMSNNYSLQQFWRDWHCSFNRWLVRYVYVPLGGRRTSTWNTFVIFTFVALWHDLTLRLLQWAWLIALLFLPEALATWVFARPRWARTRYFRFLCSAGGALNIAAMMAANLVGFGDEGVDAMLAKFASRQGAVFLGAAFVVLNAHLQVMFELREHERRQEFAARSDAAAKSEVSQAESTASRPSPSRAKAS